MRIPPLIWLLLISSYLSLMGSDKVLVYGQCLKDQKVLLLELKKSLVFDDSMSTKLMTWEQNSDSWDGVECKNGIVVGLNLCNESISSGINLSSSLFRLQYLEKINLAYNSFNSSPFPTGFGNLRNLVYLNLSYTGFTGQVPVEISQLARLEILDLSRWPEPIWTSQKLEIPNLKMLVENLTELRELYLDWVNISAVKVEWCNVLSSSPLENLQVLSLFGSFLTGPIDSSLLKLRSLSVIQLSYSNLFSVPGFFANFTNLTAFRLINSGLNGNFPQEIFQLSTLQTLDLTNNPFLQGSIPEFRENSSLQTLVLSGTNFSGRLPDSIGNLKKLSRIELVNCRFDGPIPSTIADLSQLVYLDLTTNNFSGPLPSFASSRNMTQLILSHNMLTGPITSTRWESLKSLINIDIRNNSLSGSIPMTLFTLPLIQKIQLDHNQFSGQLNGSLVIRSYTLDTLDLTGNKLYGPISSLFALRGLKYLSLSSNNFNGSLHLEVLHQLKDLAYLGLSYNNLFISSTNSNTTFLQLTTFRLASCQLRAIPRFLENQSRLMTLDLSDNHIQGGIPAWIWGLNYLQYLNLSVNLLDDMGSSLPVLNHDNLSILDLHSNKLQAQVLSLPPLATYLDYSNNSFNLVIPDSISANLSVVIFFSLSKNNLTGSIPDSICQAQYLQVLDLSDNNLTGFMPVCLVNMTSLKILNLRNNRLQGIIPHIPAGLMTLDLNGNHLEGELPKSLGKCTMLEALDIGNNQLNGTFPCQLKSIPTLRVLVLRSNEFSGKFGCPKVEDTWKMIQIVDISSNNFSGELPGKLLATWEPMKTRGDLNYLHYPFLRLSKLYYQDMVSVTSKGLELELVKILNIFTALDFSCNHFEGPIPEELGDLKALHLLNLSHNALSGSIMSGLGNLLQLESLDLSYNMLGGKIPQQFSQLTFLSYINLSFNQLVGSIPDTLQFSTFTEDSYLGNSGLCGPPLQQRCAVSSTNSTSGKNGSSQTGYNWHFISVELGFIVGFASLVAYITLLPRGQIWSDDLVEKLLKIILPLLGLSRK